MKILDRYILTTYLKTFFSVFIILMLIFVLQTIWLYIRELSGKDLDIGVIFKFLFYFMPKLIPLVLPLTILLASIMVFGSFAENYEFAAMKSTGISLQRAMSGLSIFIVALGIVTFFFSNNVIPWAELKSFNLRSNIAKSKPAMLLAKGQFNEIQGTAYNIKFDKKYGDKDQFLDNVTIHVRGNDGRTNATIIKSKSGELANEKDSNVLKLILFDGNYYSDLATNSVKSRDKKPFAKSTFEKYTINIDLSQMNNVDFDEQSQTDKYNMLDVIGLQKTIDSLSKQEIITKEIQAKSLFQRSNIIPFKKIGKQINPDSLYSGPVLDMLNTEQKLELVDASLKTISSTKQAIITNQASGKLSKEWLNKHIISLHEKFALGFACIILFFVGAPLGALIRKGGIGLPMVIAIVLFLTYHFIGIFATNSAKNGSFNPIIAAWFSTLIMLPLGIFLTRRATADKGLFDFDNLIEPVKKLFNIKENSTEYKFLSSYKKDRLLDVINNFETLGHPVDCRYEAIKILNERGISTNQLRDEGLNIDITYDTSERIVKNHKEHSKFSVTLYTIGVVLLILHFVFNNNKLPSLASASIQLSIVSLALYLIYYAKSLLNAFNFYNHINKTEKKPNLFLIITGIPLYFIAHLFINDKMKEDLKLNCLESLK